MRNLVSDDLPAGGQSIFAWARKSEHRAATYEIVLWSTGYISCSCGGWVFKRKPNPLKPKPQPRWCSHLEEGLFAEGQRLWADYQRGIALPELDDDPRGREYNETPVEKPRRAARIPKEELAPSLRPGRSFEVS